jgi:hypothetical protein
MVPVGGKSKQESVWKGEYSANTLYMLCKWKTIPVPGIEKVGRKETAEQGEFLYDIFDVL